MQEKAGLIVYFSSPGLSVGRLLVKMRKWMSEEESECESERDRMSNVFSGCHQSHGQDVDVSVIGGPNHSSGGGGVVMSKFTGQIHCQMTQGRVTEAPVSFSVRWTEKKERIVAPNENKQGV